MKLNKYKITVSANGYDSLESTITASNKEVVRNHVKYVVGDWLQQNALGKDSRGLAFVKIELSK